MKKTLLALAMLSAFGSVLVGRAADEKLTIWTSLEGPELTWLSDTAKRFEGTAAGKGHSVEVVFIPFNEINNKLIQSAPTGQGPDVIGLIPHDRIGPLASAGVLEPVASYLSSSQKSDTPTSSMDALSYNGSLLGFPAFGEAVAVIYNKKLLPAGIPKSWSAFISGAQKLTDASNQKFGFLANIAQPYSMFGFYSAMGAYVFGKDSKGALNPNDVGLGNEGAVKGAQLANDLRYKYNLVPDGTQDGQVQKDLFLRGKVAMWLTGPWDVGDIKKSGMEYGIGVPPRPTGAVGDFSPFIGIQGVLVSAYANDKKLASSLAQFVANSDNQLAMNKIGGRIPVSKRAVTKLKSDPVVTGFGAAIKKGIPMPNIPEMGKVWDPWGSAIALTIQTATPDYSGILGKAVTQIKAGK
jgi:arabinogalactan oligomer / maltooligosaccharide transport system substrate-binding protein